MSLILRLNGDAQKKRDNRESDDIDDIDESTFKSLISAILGLDIKPRIVADVVLCVTIHHAKGIDNKITNPNRIYRVIYSVKTGEEFSTTETEGFPDPVWNYKECIPFGSLKKTSRFLILDVVRVHNKSDPGSSTGMVLVGSAAISVPMKLNRKKTRRVALLKKPLGGGQNRFVEGHLAVSMEVKKIKIRYY